MVSHHGESRLGYLWAFLGPSLQLIGVVVIFDLVLHRHAPLGRSTALFVLTGFVSYFLYSKTALYVSGAVAGNRNLLALPPIKPYDVIFARVILEASTYLLVGFMMFVGLYFVGIAEAAPADFLTIIEACLLGIGFGLGVGMINIVLSGYFHNWMIVFGIMNFPTWMLSGVWFLPEQLPETYRHWMLYNPIMHVVMLFRMGFYPDYKGEFLDMPYLLTTVGISVALGMSLMKVCARRVLSPL
jgi:capsular polysaccharide transport system permease protein